MNSMRRFLFAMLLAPVPALAQDLSPLSPSANAQLPHCGPELDGQTMCRFGVIYECEFINPTSLERRTGWRWKSDLSRGCDVAHAPDHRPYYGQEGLPPGFTYAPQINESGTQSGQPAIPGYVRPGRRY
jgi:hypothetical protein